MYSGVDERFLYMEEGWLIVGKFNEITPQTLRDGVMELLSNEQIKENCQRMSMLLCDRPHNTEPTRKVTIPNVYMGMNP